MKRPLLRTGPASVIGLFLIAACNGDDPLAPKPAASPATPLTTWVSPQPCQIGFTYYGLQDVGTTIPSGGSVCGVGWSMYFPPNSDIYRGIWWYADEPSTPFRTLFSAGFHSTWLFGPIEITFNQAIKDFSLVAESKENIQFPEYTEIPLRDGTYMVALDAAGQRLDSVSFDANVMVSEKTFLIPGIKKILLYPVIKRYDYGTWPLPDRMVFRASFATMPPGELTCTPPAPTRGQIVTCTVTGAGVLATGWNFTGPAYDSLGASLNIKRTTSGNSWFGQAVASGVVSARISVNGVPQPDSLRSAFIVINRTGPAWHWKKDPLYWNFGDTTATDCYNPDFAYNEGGVMGWNVRAGTCDAFLITPYPKTSIDKGYTLQSVTDGPNTGLWYVKTISYKMNTEADMAPSIKNGSKKRWKVLEPTQQASCTSAGVSTTVNFYDFNSKCKGIGAVVNAFHQGLKWHEGYGKQNSSGHQGQLEDSAALTKNDMYRLVEKVYHLGKDSTGAAVRREADFVTQRLGASWQDHTNVYDNWCGDLWRWARSPGTMFLFGPVRQTGGRCL